jgi:hypothetical protein
MKYAANVSSSRRKSRKVSSHHLFTGSKGCIDGHIQIDVWEFMTRQTCAALEPS